VLGRMVRVVRKVLRADRLTVWATDDLRSRFSQAEQGIRQLKEGSDSVRATVATKTCVSFIEQVIILIQQFQAAR